MDEDDDAPGGEHDVGAAGQSLVMQPVSKARGVKEPTHAKFRLCIDVPDQRHLLAACFVRQDRMTSSLWG